MLGARARTLAPLVLTLALGAIVAPPARADDDDAGDVDDDDDDFDTSWFGARLGVFYRPTMDMELSISGRSRTAQAFTALLGTRVDIKDDLGVTETVDSEYMFEDGIVEGEVFFDTRFASVSVWGILPYEYRGDVVLTRTINFGGQQFSASTPVESKFRQYHAGIDIKINLINNQFVRLSPIIGVRLLGADWEVQATQLNIKGDTSDIDTPLKYDDAAILPYPEVGAEVRAGLRKWIEVDLKITGSYVAYFGMEGSTLTAEAGVTGYPIPFVGVRLGLRLMQIDLESTDQDDAQDSFDMDLEYFGPTLSVIVRFG
jgi:hypothetical protein